MKLSIIMQRLLIAGSVVIAGPALADSPTAEALSYTCAGCHGFNGSSDGPAIPSIAGIDQDYFIDSMNTYAKDERKSTIMGRIARGYTADEIEAMAGFFKAQKMVPLKQSFNSGSADDGKKLHKKYCEKCHEDGGQSPEGSMSLAGQPSNYIKYSFEDFQAGYRDAPKKMKKKIQSMHKKAGDAGFEQLINYYASQQ